MSRSTLPVALPNPQYVRRLPECTLVGVVHDHPASVERVRRIVREAAHETLALELPPLAVGLYRSHATETGPAGGEMSAAIEESGAAVVGIDGPSARFVRTFHRYLEREGIDEGTRGRLESHLETARRRAMRCRLAATELGRGRALDGDRVFDHDCDPESGREDRAADERSHVASARAAAAFSPPHVAHRDAIREECMAAAIRECPNPVVAVVGIGHLDELAARLR
ncbi:MAG: hypothetical protein QXG03_02985 [Halalkalicoccus sp.]